MKAYCGLNCDECDSRSQCKGCVETDGRPFGGTCILAECCKTQGCENCGNAFEAPCRLKQELIKEFNALGIPDMEEITDLHALAGFIVNLEYPLPNGAAVKFWEDNRVVFGTQVHVQGRDRCYGLAADEHYLMVSEYGENGTDPEIIVFKKR